MPQQAVPVGSGGTKRFSQPERRAELRCPCNAEISLQPLTTQKGKPWHSARIRNISLSSIGLHMDSEIQSGTILSLKFDGEHPRFARPLLARVTRATAQSGGAWHLGCTFVVPLGVDQLQAVVSASQLRQELEAEQAGECSREGSSSFLRPSMKERRASPRRRVAIPVLVAPDSMQTDTSEGLAIDSSTIGLGLLSSRPFTRGTVIQVRPAQAPRKIPWVKVNVRSCRPQQRQWVIGVRFLVPPSADVLISFG
jgi:hypothetical protein